MGAEDLMDKLVKAQKELAAADSARDKVMRRRDDAVRAALAAGVTYARIREITGMSPATISKAVKR